jgi:hypothetical protein
VRLSAVACAVLVAGCGAGSSGPAATPTIDMARYGPRHAVERSRPPAPVVRPKLTPDVDRELVAGAVGVVDVGGNVGVRPTVLETSSDAAVEKLDWSRWTRSVAEASGELRVLDCQPSCATGQTRRVRATVRLTDVRQCDGRRYFGTAEVTVAEGPRPTSYVRAPC